MKRHDLKILPEYFNAVINNTKNFEIRKNDRNYQVGDILVLNEYFPNQGYSGKKVERIITYITDFMQQPDYIVMAVRPL